MFIAAIHLATPAFQPLRQICRPFTTTRKNKTTQNRYMIRFTIIVFLLTGFLIKGFGQLQTGVNIAVAETESGKVRGIIRNGIYTYKGIPYATAERFEAPKKVEPWEGIRSSMTWGPVAPLETATTPLTDELKYFFNHDMGTSGEDCLVLNIWTPEISDSKKRPVMFWIHGGVSRITCLSRRESFKKRRCRRCIHQPSVKYFRVSGPFKIWRGVQILCKS